MGKPASEQNDPWERPEKAGHGEKPTILKRESMKLETSKETKGFSRYLKEQNIEFSVKRIFIDGMGAMAHGLFCSLLIGCIINTIGTWVPLLNKIVVNPWGSEVLAGANLLIQSKTACYAVQGAAMGVAIAYSMKASPFIIYSCCAVGYAANALAGAGGPLAVFFVVICAVFCGKLVSKRTPLDIIVTPFVTVVSGVLVAYLIAPPIGELAQALGTLVMKATKLAPFPMGILCSALMGILLTLPISSAAICAGLGLAGLAGGACVAGCCCHMVGFAVLSYKDNGINGLFSVGLGTSMLQVPNLIRNGLPINNGMGTSGLCGQIGTITGWFSPAVEENLALGIDFAAVNANMGMQWAGLILCSFVLPVVFTLPVYALLKKKGLIKAGDYKLDL